MKAAALVLLLASAALADEPKCLEPSERIALAQTLVAKDARIASLETSLKSTPSPAVVVVLVVAGVLIGGAVGYGVSRAVK